MFYFIRSLKNKLMIAIYKFMKPDQIYEELKNLAEKLDLTVSEQNFRMAGIKVNSGLCKVKGKSIYYIDKHKSMHKKNQMLAECLSGFSYEDIYIMPFPEHGWERVFFMAGCRLDSENR